MPSGFSKETTRFAHRFIRSLEEREIVREAHQSREPRERPPAVEAGRSPTPGTRATETWHEAGA